MDIAATLGTSAAMVIGNARLYRVTSWPGRGTRIFVSVRAAPMEVARASAVI